MMEDDSKKQKKLQGERLRQAINEVKFKYGFRKDTELLDKIGYTKTYLSAVMCGAFPITEKLLWRLEDTYKISPEFVRNGEGPMFDSDEDIAGQVEVGDSLNRQLLRAVAEIQELRKSMVEVIALIERTQAAIDEKDRQISRLLGLLEKQ